MGEKQKNRAPKLLSGRLLPAKSEPATQRPRSCLYFSSLMLSTSGPLLYLEALKGLDRLWRFMKSCVTVTQGRVSSLQLGGGGGRPTLWKSSTRRDPPYPTHRTPPPCEKLPGLHTRKLGGLQSRPASSRMTRFSSSQMASIQIPSTSSECRPGFPWCLTVALRL